MPQIPDKSIDMILCDLPYGTTSCRWDEIIPFKPLWEQYERVIKDKGAIVLFGSQPFTSKLIVSNINLFRHCWVWDKKMPSGFLNSKIMPMKRHEDVLVFCKNGNPYYYPIMKQRKNKRVDKRKPKIYGVEDSAYGIRKALYGEYDERFPTSIIEFSNANQSIKQHPTQKPVDLCEYLIRTYTNEGDLVLDNCIGSGTTAVACINTKRNFIGIELEEKYYKIALERIAKTPRPL